MWSSLDILSVNVHCCHTVHLYCVSQSYVVHLAINIGQYRVPRGAHHGLELGLNALIRFFLQLDTRGHKIIFALSFGSQDHICHFFSSPFVNSPSILRESLERTKFMFRRQLRNGTKEKKSSDNRLSGRDYNPDKSI